MSYSPVTYRQDLSAPSDSTAASVVTDHTQTQGRLRIALLGYRSHPHVGGQGIYLHYLSKALVDLGHSVDVISGPPYPELDSRVRLIQLPSLDLYAHPNPIDQITVDAVSRTAQYGNPRQHVHGVYAAGFAPGRSCRVSG